MCSPVKFDQFGISILALCLLAWTAFAQGDPIPATSAASAQKLGSVLVYNFYTSNASNPSLEETDFSLTNTNPAEGVTVHLFFVNAATNQTADTFLTLAPRQTQSFLASIMAPGNAGFVVAVAVHATSGCPISFNYLSGDAYLKLASGHTASLPAIAFAALYNDTLGSCDINSTTASLDFNGNSYNEAPRALAIDNVLSPGDSNSMLLIVNRLGGSLAFQANAASLGTNSGILYNGDTNFTSFAFAGSNAQFRSPLSNSFPRIPSGFSSFVLPGTSGWMKFWPGNDTGILGAILNLNPNAGTNLTAFTGGHNLRHLTLSSAATLTIPVYPPTLKADLALGLAHTGNFTIGSTGDYTLTVNNAVLAKPATGTIKITDTLPGNLTLQSFSGADWNCTGIGTTNVNCANSSGLAAGASLPTLTLTVNVGAGTPSSITNTATVSVAPQQESNAANNSASDTLSLTVNCSTLTITPSTLPAGLTGVPYSQSLSATSGSGAVSYSLNNGSSLPNWLSLSAAGVLSGTPPQDGSAAFTIKAIDSNGCMGFQSYVLSWNFVVGGTPVTTLGQAQLSLGADGSIIVSGLNNPGLNGYTMQLGQATGAGAILQPTTDLRPNGNSIAMQTQGQVNGVAGQVISTSSFSGNGTNVIYRVDFSGIGSTQSLFQLYGATGNILRAFVGPNLSPLTFSTGGLPYTATAKTFFESRSNTTKTSLGTPVTVGDLANITTTGVVEISVTALHPTATINYVSDASVLAHLNQGTLAASQPTVGVFGLPFETAHPLLPGEAQTATLSAGLGALTVSNIGSSGNDGVALRLNLIGCPICRDGIFIGLEPFTTAARVNASPTGAWMQVGITGTLNAIPNQSLGRLRTTKTQTPLLNINPTQSKTRQLLAAPLSNTSEAYAVTVDFGVILSPTHRIQIYNSGALVADISGHIGAVGTTSAWPLSFAQRVVATAANPLVALPGFIATYPASTIINIGGTPYVGAELRVTAEGSGVTIDNLTDFKLTAAGLTEFTIANAQIIPTNNPPAINTVALTRQAGSPVANTIIANVNDIEDAKTTLSVKVNNAASAAVNGITVSGISVNNAGAVTANVIAACDATNASFALTVTDTGGAVVSTAFDVNINANTPPSLGAYPATVTLNSGAGTTVMPSALPSDNGLINNITAVASGFTGNISVNQTTDVITIGNAGPPGNYTVMVTATDNCGASSQRTFLLNVLNSCGITVNPATLSSASFGVPFVQTLSASPTGSYTFSLSDSTLPSGIALVNVLGIYSLRGTPTVHGTYNFTIKAKKNGSTCESIRAYTMTIP